jgi:endoglucanase
MVSFKAGINLGGWISQYKVFSKSHFDTFITQRDIAIIAEAGFDHVRVPFDYQIIESDDDVGKYKEEGLLYIDRCLMWCKKYNLGLLLDMHHAPGYVFIDLKNNTLFENPAQQKRFIEIWRFLTKRYMDEREHIAFELLNEIVEPDSNRWNKLMPECIKAIREIDPTRWIYIGGNNYNSPDELKNLADIEDDYLVYNFHFYNPFFFTHQKAHWSESALVYNREVMYPGQYEGIEDFVKENPKFDFMMEVNNLKLNKELLRKDLKPAIEFRDKKKCKLYCGEFGVIALADLESRIRWHEDYVGLLEEYDIGGAVWNYKDMDFEIFNSEGNPVSKELINILTRKKYNLI